MMKSLKTYFAAALALAWSVGVTVAKPIDETTAKKVAAGFAKSTDLGDYTRMSLAMAETGGASDPRASSTPSAYFYAFNMEGQGFVIVAGDDLVTPILGYSTQGSINAGELPSNVRKWLDGYKREIAYARANFSYADDATQKAWKQCLEGNYSTGTTGSGKRSTVSPLVKTQWDQSPYVNDMCPSKSVTGCVATAMAQIMKYHNYPATGTGFHSYNHSQYGTVSANFSTATYNWAAMPNKVNSPNSAVALLMFHCGVSVDMNYSPQSSGAFVISSRSPITNCSEYALKEYFGYDPKTMKGVERDDYSPSGWNALLKFELDEGRPILYAGFGSGGGHAFVCDGYDINNFYHFNWGWGGAYDGYFASNALNPSGVGTGGGSGGFNSGQQVIIGIQPKVAGPSPKPLFNLQISDPLQMDNQIVNYGQLIGVRTNVANIGGGDFTGSLGAAVFDENNVFIEFIEEKSVTLKKGNEFFPYSYFSNTSVSLGIVPGAYKLAIYFKTDTTNWQPVGDDGAYSNLTSFDVVYSASIELYSTIVIDGGNDFVQGQSKTVRFNVANESELYDFKGEFAATLYDLQGKFVQNLGVYQENTGLPKGFSYTNPLQVNSAPITADPGTYLLIITYRTQGTTQPYIAGSSYFKNPIRVIVKEAPVPKDAYEDNNTQATAYKLPAVYNNNVSMVGTTGSNIHINGDVDYYKVDLPAGYKYELDATLWDADNQKGSSNFTVDALFSYSLDGIGWSETIDASLVETIEVEGPRTIFLKVAPYFAGNTGTYLLELEVNRESTGNVAVGEASQRLSELVSVYPNPANNVVHVDLSKLETSTATIHLMTMDGKSISTNTHNLNSAKLVEVQVGMLPAGIYMLGVQTGNGMAMQKITIVR